MSELNGLEGSSFKSVSLISQQPTKTIVASLKLVAVMLLSQATSPSLPLLVLCTQAQRLHEKKEHSTQEQALDPKTRLLLFKMVDSGMLTEINGCISTGKEACVYHAEGGR